MSHFNKHYPYVLSGDIWQISLENLFVFCFALALLCDVRAQVSAGLTEFV